MNCVRDACMTVPIQSCDKNHLYGGASDPLSQTFRKLELCRVEEEHLGRVVVVHAPRHPRSHRELSRTVVHAHLETFSTKETSSVRTLPSESTVARLSG